MLIIQTSSPYKFQHPPSFLFSGEGQSVSELIRKAIFKNQISTHARQKVVRFWASSNMCADVGFILHTFLGGGNRVVK